MPSTKEIRDYLGSFPNMGGGHESSQVKSKSCFSDSVIHIIKYISIIKYMLRRVLEDVEVTLFET